MRNSVLESRDDYGDLVNLAANGPNVLLNTKPYTLNLIPGSLLAYGPP